jgi:hypothetical protein
MDGGGRGAGAILVLILDWEKRHEWASRARHDMVPQRLKPLRGTWFTNYHERRINRKEYKRAQKAQKQKER